MYRHIIVLRNHRLHLIHLFIVVPLLRESSLKSISFQRSTTQVPLLTLSFSFFFFLPPPPFLHFFSSSPLSTSSSVPELFSIPLLSFVKWFCPDTSGSGWSALPWEHTLQPQVASTMNTLLSQFPSCCHGSTFGAAGLLSRTSLIPWYEQKLDLISAFDQITSQQSAIIRKFLCLLCSQSSGLCVKKSVENQKQRDS